MEDAPIFVYGTLKKGEPNHYLLNDKTIGNSKFLGKAKLIDEYPLVISPNSNVPLLLPKKGTGKIAEGELYQVDTAVLHRLDQLEGHPVVYVRTNIDCVLVTDSSEQLLSDATMMKCQVYFLPDFKPALLDLPYISDYKDTVERPYFPASKRSTSLLEEAKISS